MMKGVIIFLSGAAVGGLTATLITRYVLKKKYHDQSEEKIKAMKEYVEFLRSKDEAGELCENLAYTSKNGEEVVKPEETSEEKQPERFHADSKVKYVDYTSYYDKSEEEHPLDDDEEDEQKAMEKAEKANNEMNSKARPKVIKATDFDDPEYEHHDKVTLYYYTEDETLTTEDNEIIDDVPALLGDALTKYGFTTNDDQVIFVRNYQRGADYEIAKVFGAYIE